MRRRIGLVLAAVALALQAFWPLIAQARPRNVNLVPLCTVDGVTHYLEVPGGQTPAEERTAKHGDHCAFCLFGGSDKAIAAPVFPGFAFTKGAAEPAFSFQPVLSESIEANSARPRAPPFSSFVPQANDESRRTDEKASMLGSAHGAAGERGSIVRLRVLHA